MKTIIYGTIVFDKNNDATIQDIAGIFKGNENDVLRIDNDGWDYIVAEEYKGTITYKNK